MSGSQACTADTANNFDRGLDLKSIINMMLFPPIEFCRILQNDMCVFSHVSECQVNELIRADLFECHLLQLVF